MRKVLFIATLLLCNLTFAQDRSHSRPGDLYYEELPDPHPDPDAEWSMLRKKINVSFADDNVRYPKKKVPSITPQKAWNTVAWKGEKVHTQILVWTVTDIDGLTIEVRDLLNKARGTLIKKENTKASFVRYVMADEFGGGCNKRKSTDYDSSLVADPIDIIDIIPVKARTVQPVWLNVNVPADIPSGIYTGIITVNALRKYDLKISVKVLEHVLPPPGNWKYDLDLWQYPAPIARIHNVDLWSNEHFELMRPYFTALANAGQKVITANIIDQPWGNTHVYFDDPGLIKWIKRRDGSWTYDYTLFDRYISFVMSCGIKQRINCYTMVTWDMSFTYFDEGLGRNTQISAKPGSSEYTEYWLRMLNSFTKHLKNKGWFDRTAIAMDERPVESMKAVISLLKQVDPAWKIALAGDELPPGIEKDIFDYSIASYLKFDQKVLDERKALGKPTTFYTACKERHPGPYTFSPPAENAWLGWHAAAKGYTGYLFWAFNTWVKEPLLDSRFRSWPSGTCYQFYPGPRTSIRFEKLIEGIQDFEKIRIIKEQLRNEGNMNGLKEIEHILSAFEIPALDSIPASEMITVAKKVLNSY
jgi:hypothetical protein